MITVIRDYEQLTESDNRHNKRAMAAGGACSRAGQWLCNTPEGVQRNHRLRKMSCSDCKRRLGCRGLVALSAGIVLFSGGVIAALAVAIGTLGSFQGDALTANRVVAGIALLWLLLAMVVFLMFGTILWVALPVPPRIRWIVTVLCFVVVLGCGLVWILGSVRDPLAADGSAALVAGSAFGWIFVTFVSRASVWMTGSTRRASTEEAIRFVLVYAALCFIAVLGAGVIVQTATRSTAWFMTVVPPTPGKQPLEAWIVLLMTLTITFGLGGGLGDLFSQWASKAIGLALQSKADPVREMGRTDAPLSVFLDRYPAWIRPRKATACQWVSLWSIATLAMIASLSAVIVPLTAYFSGLISLLGLGADQAVIQFPWFELGLSIFAPTHAILSTRLALIADPLVRMRWLVWAGALIPIVALGSVTPTDLTSLPTKTTWPFTYFFFAIPAVTAMYLVISLVLPQALGLEHDSPSAHARDRIAAVSSLATSVLQATVHTPAMSIIPLALRREWIDPVKWVPQILGFIPLPTLVVGIILIPAGVLSLTHLVRTCSGKAAVPPVDDLPSSGRAASRLAHRLIHSTATNACCEACCCRYCCFRCTWPLGVAAGAYLEGVTGEANGCLPCWPPLACFQQCNYRTRLFGNALGRVAIQRVRIISHLLLHLVTLTLLTLRLFVPVRGDVGPQVLLGIAVGIALVFPAGEAAVLGPSRVSGRDREAPSGVVESQVDAAITRALNSLPEVEGAPIRIAWVFVGGLIVLSSTLIYAAIDLASSGGAGGIWVMSSSASTVSLAQTAGGMQFSFTPLRAASHAVWVGTFVMGFVPLACCVGAAVRSAPRVFSMFDPRLSRSLSVLSCCGFVFLPFGFLLPVAIAANTDAGASASVLRWFSALAGLLLVLGISAATIALNSQITRFASERKTKLAAHKLRVRLRSLSALIGADTARTLVDVHTDLMKQFASCAASSNSSDAEAAELDDEETVLRPLVDTLLQEDVPADGLPLICATDLIDASDVLPLGKLPNLAKEEVRWCRQPLRADDVLCCSAGGMTEFARGKLPGRVIGTQYRVGEHGSVTCCSGGPDPPTRVPPPPPLVAAAVEKAIPVVKRMLNASVADEGARVPFQGGVRRKSHLEASESDEVTRESDEEEADPVASIYRDPPPLLNRKTSVDVSTDELLAAVLAKAFAAGDWDCRRFAGGAVLGYLWSQFLDRGPWLHWKRLRGQSLMHIDVTGGALVIKRRMSIQATSKGGHRRRASVTDVIAESLPAKRAKAALSINTGMAAKSVARRKWIRAAVAARESSMKASTSLESRRSPDQRRYSAWDATKTSSPAAHDGSAKSTPPEQPPRGDWDTVAHPGLGLGTLRAQSFSHDEGEISLKTQHMEIEDMDDDDDDDDDDSESSAHQSEEEPQQSQPQGASQRGKRRASIVLPLQDEVFEVMIHPISNIPASVLHYGSRVLSLLDPRSVSLPHVLTPLEQARIVSCVFDSYARTHGGVRTGLLLDRMEFIDGSLPDPPFGLVTARDEDDEFLNETLLPRVPMEQLQRLARGEEVEPSARDQMVQVRCMTRADFLLLGRNMGLHKSTVRGLREKLLEAMFAAPRVRPLWYRFAGPLSDETTVVALDDEWDRLARGLDRGDFWMFCQWLMSFTQRLINRTPPSMAASDPDWKLLQRAVLSAFLRDWMFQSRVLGSHPFLLSTVIKGVPTITRAMEFEHSGVHILEEEEQYWIGIVEHGLSFLEIAQSSSKLSVDVLLKQRQQAAREREEHRRLRSIMAVAAAQAATVALNCESLQQGLTVAEVDADETATMFQSGGAGVKLRHSLVTSVLDRLAKARGTTTVFAPPLESESFESFASHESLGWEAPDEEAQRTRIQRASSPVSPPRVARPVIAASPTTPGAVILPFVSASPTLTMSPFPQQQPSCRARCASCCIRTGMVLAYPFVLLWHGIVFAMIQLQNAMTAVVSAIGVAASTVARWLGSVASATARVLSPSPSLGTTEDPSILAAAARLEQEELLALEEARKAETRAQRERELQERRQREETERLAQLERQRHLEEQARLKMAEAQSDEKPPAPSAPGRRRSILEKMFGAMGLGGSAAPAEAEDAVGVAEERDVRNSTAATVGGTEEEDTEEEEEKQGPTAIAVAAATAAAAAASAPKEEPKEAPIPPGPELAVDSDSGGDDPANPLPDVLRLALAGCVPKRLAGDISDVDLVQKDEAFARLVRAHERFHRKPEDDDESVAADLTGVVVRSRADWLKGLRWSTVTQAIEHLIADSPDSTTLLDETAFESTLSSMEDLREAESARVSHRRRSSIQVIDAAANRAAEEAADAEKGGTETFSVTSWSLGNIMGVLEPIIEFVTIAAVAFRGFSLSLWELPSSQALSIALQAFVFEGPLSEQLAAFGVTGSSTTTTTTTTSSAAAGFGDGATPVTTFKILFWVCVGIAFLFPPYALRGVRRARRGILGLVRSKDGSLRPAPMLSWEGMYMQFLTLLGGIGFFFVIKTLLGILACSYTTAGAPLYQDPTIQCWSTLHIVWVTLAVVGGLLYYPLALFISPSLAYANPQVDVKYTLDWTVVASQSKLLLSAAMVFFPNQDQLVIPSTTAIVVSIALAVYLFSRRPCLIDRVNVWRGCLLIMAAYPNALLLLLAVGIPALAAKIALVAGWALGIASALFLDVCHGERLTNSSILWCCNGCRKVEAVARPSDDDGEMD
jgi:hypothetical protein